MSRRVITGTAGALLCAGAEGGTVLIDRGSFERAGFEPLDARIVRLRSRKLRQRVEAVRLRCSGRGAPRPFTWLPSKPTMLPSSVNRAAKPFASFMFQRSSSR